MARESLISRYQGTGLRIPGHWVAIPVVLGSIADENATFSLDFANEIRASTDGTLGNGADAGNLAILSDNAEAE